MYTQHFKMRERPFKLVHDPVYLYVSRAHQKALELLADGVRNGGGIFELTGETGTGKTTVCHAFMDSLDERTGAVLVSNPRGTAKQLLEMMNGEFNVETGSGSIEDHMAGLEAWLRTQKKAGKNSLILIDEAQDLIPEVVELLCQLCELEVDSHKLLKIVLSGHLAAEAGSASVSLERLKEKVTDGYCLTPMDWNETRDYILHRIQISSLAENSKDLFSRSALQAVYKNTGGIPRLINILCNRALITAYLMNSSRVSGASVQSAIKEMRGGGSGDSGWRMKGLHGFCLGILCVAISLFWGWHHVFWQKAHPDPPRSHAAVNSVAPVEKRYPIVSRKAQPLPEFSPPMAGRDVPFIPEPAGVTGLRYWRYKNKTRVVIDLDSRVNFTHTREDENRLVIDMEHAFMGGTDQKVSVMGNRVIQAETTAYSSESVRTVIQVRPDTAYKIFSLNKPFRIVVDVKDPLGKPEGKR